GRGARGAAGGGPGLLRPRARAPLPPVDRQVGRLAARDDLRPHDLLHADVHGAGVADVPDGDAVGAVLRAAVDGPAGDDVRVLHDPGAGGAARHRAPGAADEHADFPGEPADPLRGLPAGDGLAPAAPPLPDGPALPAEGAHDLLLEAEEYRAQATV